MPRVCSPPVKDSARDLVGTHAWCSARAWFGARAWVGAGANPAEPMHHRRRPRGTNFASVQPCSVMLGAVAFLLAAQAPIVVRAEPPSTSYIFPAGGQRGTRVTARVGGHYLHDRCGFEMLGPGVTTPASIERTETLWLEGPIVRLPASQRAEEYPQDYRAAVTLAADAPLGSRPWRCWNAQGATAARRFIVGDLPEVVEDEQEGEPLPVAVTLPVTVNGRVFPREDVDVWTLTPPVGRVVTCALAATSIGSPLEARLEVRDPHGQPVAEATGAGGGDPLLQFPVREAGVYEVRIHDVRGEGLQPFVYRLTITDGPWVRHVFPLGAKRDADVAWQLTGANLPEMIPPRPLSGAMTADRADMRWQIGDRTTNTVVLALGDLTEHLEVEPNDEAVEAAMFLAPRVLNGRIGKPGDRDCWTCMLPKGEEWAVETQAARFGSPLDGVLRVTDAKGREVARGGAEGPSPDPLVRFTPAEDGAYTITVTDRFASRGGPDRAYRLKVVRAQPSVRLELATDVLNVDRGASQKLAVQVLRDGGFKEPVTLAVEGLPEGVEATEVVVAPNQNRGELVFKPLATARVTATRVRVIGRTQLHGQAATITAATPARGAELGLDQVLLAVTLPTPFKFQGTYEMTYIPCGAVSRKRFVIERNGYEGPLEVRLADRQTRHLQGVTGPSITLPPGATEFVYPITLPPWMELGRTSRAVLMAIGEVDDGQGGRHKVSFTSGDQNNQMVNLVSPSPLRILLDRATVAVTPQQSSKVKVQLRRDRALQSPVRLELVAPAHLRDVSAQPVELAATDESGELTLVYGARPGPFTMPVLIRATARRGDDPLVAEAPLELVTIP